MRILFLTNLYPPPFLGGYELLCEEVASALSHRGHEVVVLTSTHGVEAPSDELINGVRVHRELALEVPYDQPYHFSVVQRARCALHNARITEQILHEFRPDIVFAWSQSRLTLGPVQAAVRAGCELAWSLNDTTILAFRDAPFTPTARGKARWALSRWILPGSSVKGLPFDKVTVISESLREQLIAGGLPVSEAKLIHQGIRPELFPPREHPGHIGSPMKVCYVGQIHRYKGVHVAVSAVIHYAEQFGPDSISLTIIGDGDPEYLKELRELAAISPASITFLPRLPHAELPPIYRAHDVFVFPSSWREPFGLTHLEAMASGLPVVSTLAGGQAEFLRDGENCLAFPVENSEALCACLRRLQTEAGLALRIATAGERLVREQYTIERYLHEIEAFLCTPVEARP